MRTPVFFSGLVVRLLGICLLSVPGIATAQATRPASTTTAAVVIPPPTPEQKAVIDKWAAVKTDQPMPRIVTAPYKKDGAPNENFGQPEPWWMQRHEQYIRRGKEPADVVFIGDSITDGWTKAKDIWEKSFGKYHPANFGIGGDRTQNVLWRTQNGELDNVRPKVVVLMIGTNNISASDAEIVKGVKAVITAIHAKLPETKILLLSIFPRAEMPDSWTRKHFDKVNDQLKHLDDPTGGRIKYFRIYEQFLEPDGKLSKDIMPDFLHPSVKGYQIWADAMSPVLDEMMR